ncbi:cytochrome c oxidase assembly protein [Pseudoroseicyclus tamaricis]|uniref:cytochrome c oxidase assembly protein n=1 Tax=Pseudoroseicyclus tamaricis TaxID=2705421 RepID=UPI001F2CA21D|nr:cytochrome c oxidase assembly protein [Pseudoroseicyclus tamaricis]
MNAIYCGAPPPPSDLWSRWNLDPVLIAALLVLAVALRRDRAALAGVGVLALAFISPLCALSSALFSARVVHHLLLVAVAAPLLAQALRGRRTESLALPTAISAAVLWAWHLPAAYDLALSNVAVYWLMQLTLVGTATWFWHAVLNGRASPVERMAFIIAGFAQMGMLGALLTFAPQQLYAAHVIAPFLWGITPLADQQLGGLIMWVPAGIPYAIAAGFQARQSWALLSREAA